ncbi:MAG: type II toxin-antitoxin system RelE/ParE family toxin [Pseudomonadota bacterium]
MQLRSKESDEDVFAIWLHIALDNPNAADKLVEKIGNTFDLLEANPLIGKMAKFKKYPKQQIRTFPVRKYLIIYSPIEGGIQILRVVHGAMDLESEING